MNSNDIKKKEIVHCIICHDSAYTTEERIFDVPDDMSDDELKVMMKYMCDNQLNTEKLMLDTIGDKFSVGDFVFVLEEFKTYNNIEMIHLSDAQWGEVDNNNNVDMENLQFRDVKCFVKS
ncbi:MAG: hypothetical protein ACRCZ9_12135 [Fusobacteriaceae bacterium]